MTRESEVMILGVCTNVMGNEDKRWEARVEVWAKREWRTESAANVGEREVW